MIAEDGSEVLNSEMAERHISLPKPFTTGDTHEWFQRFEICCRANGWNQAAHVLKLPTLLEGEALAIWLELSEEEQKDYATAEEKIVNTIAPIEFVSLDEFHSCKLQPSESLSVFVHRLKKLLDRAMPGLETSAREQLLLHQFLAGVPESISRQLRATGETKKLETAVVRARLLMTIEDRSNVAAISKKGPSSSEVEMLQEQVAALTEQVATLATRSSGGQQQREQRRCYGCRQTGHTWRDCPLRRRQGRGCFNCNRPGHIARDCFQRQQGNDQGASVKGNGRPFHQ